MTETFSIIAADLLLGKIKYILTFTGFNVSLDSKKYELVISKMKEKSSTSDDDNEKGNEIEESQPAELSIQILKMKESRFCIEFSRNRGDYFSYVDMLKTIRLLLADLAC